jgi:hypothetical protein
MRTNFLSPRRVLAFLLPIASLALLVLHYRHLAADFPNGSPWMDWAKYTDEGWYGDAAIRHYEWGRWNVPGDFNPAAALPVWPFLEALLFHWTGVSLVAARALTVTVFGGILATTWLLVERAEARDRQEFGGAGAPPMVGLAAPMGMLLLAASPFCFVFSRLAILEPLMVLFLLLTLLATTAVCVPPAPDPAFGVVEALALVRRNWLPLLLLGILVTLMILTKTTSIFLLPALGWMLFAAARYRLRPLLAVALPAGLVAAALWSVYFFGLVRPHYLADYRYLFSANGYTGITRATALKVIGDSWRGGVWIGRAIYPLALLAAIIALAQVKRLRQHRLIPALMLWAGGYIAFLAYHSNMQPRYYFVIAVPVTLLPCLVLDDLLLPRVTMRVERWALMTFAGVIAAAILANDVATLTHYLRHPEYTYLDAARSIQEVIVRDQQTDPGHSALVLSISGSDLSLMTGLRSICDDFGTMELADRVKLYRPGWYVAWNDVEDDKMDALSPLYKLQRVATFLAMDDPDRNLLILYKLVDADGQPEKPLRREIVPKRMQTKLGQQPSEEQLEH